MTTIDIQAEIAAGRELIAKLPAVKDFALIGSASYRPDPHDVDFAILIDPAHNAVEYCTTLINDGWGNCGDYDGVGGIWAAVRRENLNLMVSHDPVFFERYKVAMEVCKALRLEHKEDRVAVCAIVRDGKTAEQVRTYGTHLSAIEADPSLVETKASHAYLGSVARTLEAWDEIMLGSVTQQTIALAQGEALVRLVEKQVADAVRSTQRSAVIGGQIVPLANVPGFVALPAPTKEPAARHWRDVLGVPNTVQTEQTLKDAYRRAASAAHPDKGGTSEAMAAVNAAYAQAKQEPKP